MDIPHAPSAGNDPDEHLDNPAGVEWFFNAGSKAAHAYAKGPGTGDRSQCGRAQLDSRAERWPAVIKCSYCLSAIGRPS